MGPIDKTPVRGSARLYVRKLALMGGLALVGMAGAAAAQPGDRPPYAKSGECYAKTVKPAVYGSESKQVVEQDGWTETKHIPAVTERIERQVLVSPERVERTYHEAVYKDVVRWVDVPGEPRVVHEPPRYKTVHEQVMVEQARYEWQRSFAPIAQGVGPYGHPVQTMVYATGEVWCKVLIPARYKTIEKTVMVSEGRSYTVPGPPRKEKVVDRVLVSEGRWSEHREQAVYRTESELRVIQPARTESIPHPARYRTETRQVTISEAKEEWVRIRCEEQTIAAPPPPPRAPYGERG